MSRKKANIRPDLVGELFTDGKDYYKLTDCQTEPLTTFLNISTGGFVLTKPISQFADFVQLKPIRPIEKKPTRAPRKDKGGTHKPIKPVKEKEPKAEATTDGTLDISTFTIKTTEKDYTMSIGDVEVTAVTLRGGVSELLEKCGINQEFVEAAPDSDGKEVLLAVLSE